MKILFLAPHPFYQDRGSPIANATLLKFLSERGNEVDVVTYAEGRDLYYQQVKLYRTPDLAFLRKIKPGFSWKKVICDTFLFFQATRLVLSQRYDLVHAVEESVFIALAFKVLFKIPYLYDMDSSLVEQLIEKYNFLNYLAPILRVFERTAVSNAKVILPVCEALAGYIQKYKPQKVVVLSDVSLLEQPRKGLEVKACQSN